MRPAPIPENEKERLAALHQYEILDTSAEKSFDSLTLLTAAICKTPIAQISLVDEDRLWFKAKCGLDIEETERDISLCGYALLQSELFIVPDTLDDDRFFDNSLITQTPPVRFYASMPLITAEGHALGTLCVIDYVPRELTKEQQQSLQILRDLIIAQLELRRSVITTSSEQSISYQEAEPSLDEVLNELKNRVTAGNTGIADINNRLEREIANTIRSATAAHKDQETLQSLISIFPDGVFYTNPDGDCTYVNKQLCQITGLTFNEAMGTGWTTSLHPEDRDRVINEWYEATKSNQVFHSEYRFKHQNGDVIWVISKATSHRDDANIVLGYVGTITDISKRKQVETMLLVEKRILEMIASRASFSEVLDALNRGVEEITPTARSSIMFLDPDGKHLRSGSAPNLPDAYTQAVDGIVVGPSIGSCGTAAYLKKQVIVTDIAEDPLWVNFRDLALRYNLRACWSTPILSTTNEVMALFAIYYQEPKAPTAEELEVIDHMVKLASIAIESQRAEEAIHNLAKGFSITSGEAFFRSFTKHLGETLDMDYVVVGELANDKRDAIRSVAVYSRGKFLEPLEYKLKGTPCEIVVGQGVRGYASAVQNEFPNFPLLVALNIDSYVGAPLFDASGQALGLIAVLNGKPIKNIKTTESVLQIFATRAAAELERKHADEVLQFTQFSIEQIAEALFWTGPDAKILDVNRAACESLGYTREELLNLNIHDFSPDLPVSAWAEHWQQIKKQGTFTIESNHRTKNGRIFPVEITVNYLKYAGKEYNCATVRDITEREWVKKKLKGAEEKFRTLVGNIPGVTYRGDMTMTKEFISDNVEVLSGYPATDFLQNAVRSFISIIHNKDQQLVVDIVTEAIGQKKPYSLEYRIVNADSSIRWVYDKGIGIFDEQGNILFLDGVIIDITEQRQANEQLTYQASHDALTGLVNRTEFERRSERLLVTVKEDKSEHALCFMDLDQFKVVNDTCGHIAGDEMLRQLALALQNATRRRDTLARLGGDEFGVLMEHCSLDDAHRVSTSLQKVIQGYQFSWEGRSFKVGVSMGLVAITKTTANLTELLKQADVACYMAKDAGRNRIHVYHAEDSELVQRRGEMQWVTRLNHALEDDRFCLYAQSIVPLDGSTEQHYELLLRMVDEKGKIIPPGAFLPAAERYNLISKLDYWV
ncbi:MAG: PAS domain S-box protein, partial [Pseudomonadales bacterium]